MFNINKYLTLACCGLLIACSQPNNQQPKDEEVFSNLDLSKLKEPKLSESDIGKSYEIDTKPSFEENQKIIKSADIKIRVDALKSSKEALNLILKKYNALLISSTMSHLDENIQNTFEIKVLAQSFDDCVNDLTKEAIYIDYQNISVEDVTEDFVDTEARAKAKKAIEQRYLELLKQAKNVQDVLAVEEKLGLIREEIEVKEGHLKYLQNRIRYSKIDLNMYEVVEKSTSPSMPFYLKIWRNLSNGFTWIGDLFIGSFYYIPLLVLGLFLAFFVRKLWIKRKKTQ